MFARLAHRRPERVMKMTLNDPTMEVQTLDPQAQVALVHQAVQNLEQVRHLVRRLPELPIGSRQELMDQLAATSDSLRSLYFIDAIY